MHLIALVESPDHVCCRYRLAALQPYWAPAGHTLELRSWPVGWRAPLRWGNDLARADLVIVQRRLLPAWELWLLRRAARRLAFDFDDAVFLRDSYARRGLHSGRRWRRFVRMVQAADFVCAGNDYLAGQAARCKSRAALAIVPTCVEAERYPLSTHHRRGAGVQLVWIGSSSTLQGLERVRGLLETLGQRCPGLVLKQICDRFLTLNHLPVLPCPWAEATETTALAEADIGISWVPDDAWSLGKCGLKVLQYMAAGLPVVANPVGVQAQLVQHGRTGFLAQSVDEWVAAIQQLAHDPDLRQRLGRAGRQRVEAEFHPRVAAQRWLGLLTQALAA